jgi:alpha-L-rhamnosidase
LYLNQGDTGGLSKFIFEKAPFPFRRALTIAETDAGLVAVWFGGTNEKEPDVGTWGSCNIGDGWTDIVEVANDVQNDQLRYPCWNPVLFQVEQRPLLSFYKVGPDEQAGGGSSFHRMIVALHGQNRDACLIASLARSRINR